MIIDPGSPGFNKSNSATAGGNKLGRPEAAPAAGKPGDSANANSSDSVSLSSQAKAMGKLEQAVQQSADVDTAKVERIKLAIANGEYQADSDAIAGRMLAQDSQF